MNLVLIWEMLAAKTINARLSAVRLQLAA